MIHKIHACYSTEDCLGTVLCEIDMKIFFTLTKETGDDWDEPRVLPQAEFHHIEIDPVAGVTAKDTIETLTDWAEQWIEYNQEECIAACLEEYERAQEYAAENRRDAR